MDKPCRLSAVIITYNEEKKLAACLASLDFVDELVVIDSGSRDRTRDIAESYHARFSVRPFDHFANQKNFGMAQARGEWILLIDADERVSLGLKKEILDVAGLEHPCVGYWFRRDNYMFGGRVRFGANRGDRQMRLIRKGKGHFEGMVHERIVLDGRAGELKEPLIHETYQTRREYFDKWNLYIDLEVRQIIHRGQKPAWTERLLKPLAQFIWFYFFRFGFLDGWRGLQFHVLSACYTYTKYKKAAEALRK
ncbi:MAG: glycosyltransferase family 2 protein [Candidatus Omnitrophica bacterium]|nr:glycosyltransferase family 2 protein [Candidatus Omnitrophota bacterium]